MNNEMNNLIEAINSLMLEMEKLKSEIKDLRKVNEEINLKLHSVNEYLSTRD
ncbi:hypothetical protein ABF176_002405 [Flavobacterium psychrophilum]|nr:hypothetical protein [Flavobacterium psychrophilum]